MQKKKNSTTRAASKVGTHDEMQRSTGTIEDWVWDDSGDPMAVSKLETDEYEPDIKCGRLLR